MQSLFTYSDICHSILQYTDLHDIVYRFPNVCVEWHKALNKLDTKKYITVKQMQIISLFAFNHYLPHITLSQTCHINRCIKRINLDEIAETPANKLCLRAAKLISSLDSLYQIYRDKEDGAQKVHITTLCEILQEKPSSDKTITKDIPSNLFISLNKSHRKARSNSGKKSPLSNSGKVSPLSNSGKVSPLSNSGKRSDQIYKDWRNLESVDSTATVYILKIELACSRIFYSDVSTFGITGVLNEAYKQFQAENMLNTSETSPRDPDVIERGNNN